MTTLSIGQLAKQAGVGVETVRYYEREGLLDEAQRKDSGYRQFGAAAIQRIKFIRRAKKLGFTLAEIKELIRLQQDPQATSSDVKARALAKIEDIDSRITSLQAMKASLTRVVDSCDGAGPIADCCILHSLATDAHVEER